MTIRLNFDKNKERDGPVTHFDFEKWPIYKATEGVRGQKNMLILFERLDRCGVNATHKMSKFYFAQKLSAFQSAPRTLQQSQRLPPTTLHPFWL